jgi:hypothetical protein
MIGIIGWYDTGRQWGDDGSVLFLYFDGLFESVDLSAHRFELLQIDSLFLGPISLEIN